MHERIDDKCDPMPGDNSVKPPFLCVRSWELGAGEDGENGRMETESSGKLRWLAASAKAEGPRNRRARRPEQWPQISATGAMFRTGAGVNDEWKMVKSPN
jgi:hypothetical protein